MERNYKALSNELIDEIVSLLEYLEGEDCNCDESFLCERCRSEKVLEKIGMPE